MKGINKQQTGFKFGQNRLKVLKEFGHIPCNDKDYKLVLVETQDHQTYYSCRLYNSKGKFIKQLLIDIPVLRSIAKMMLAAYPPGYGGWR